MRKFTLLIVLALVSAVVFGQYATKEMQLRKDNTSFIQKQGLDKSEFSKTATWTNDFSNPADWTIGLTSPDEAIWAICTYATAPTDWIPVYGMPGTFESTTVDNGFALFNSDWQGGAGAPLQDAWIQLVNPIDLSSVASPRFYFTSYYKRWEDTFFFEYSLDGGTTWGSKTLLNEIVQGQATAVDQLCYVNVPEAGNQASVLIRFRLSGDWDYGCFIDDMFVDECPAYDIRMLETATNFFITDDYSDGDGYHYSSHNGMIPFTVLTNANAAILFNAVVMNTGTTNATPEVNVTITDPNSTEAYNFTFTSDVELAPGVIDTLDIAWFEDEPFYTTLDTWVFGQWDIDFELSIVGQEDGYLDGNTYSTYYMATDNVYAKDGGNLDSYIAPTTWSSGGSDGDMMAVDYLLYESTTIDSVQAFITSNSDVATTLVAHVMVYDSGSSSWVDVSSSMITIEAANIDSWLTFTFADPADVTAPVEGEAYEIKIALEFQNGTSDLYIGEDNTMPSSAYSTSWNFVSDPGWTTITNYYDACPMIRACLPVVGVNVNDETTSNISIYPNPSTGIVNIANVEGASIEVLNIMGQIVASVENSSEINNIDLSNNANGTYFVRVVKGNEVSTTKINLVK